MQCALGLSAQQGLTGGYGACGGEVMVRASERSSSFQICSDHFPAGQKYELQKSHWALVILYIWTLFLRFWCNEHITGFPTRSFPGFILAGVIPGSTQTHKHLPLLLSPVPQVLVVLCFSQEEKKLNFILFPLLVFPAHARWTWRCPLLLECACLPKFSLCLPTIS